MMSQRFLVEDLLRKLGVPESKSGLGVAPFSPRDAGLAGVYVGAVILLWYLGDFHTYHGGDTVLHSLTSLYRWEPFAWEMNQHGELLALLTTWIRRPYWNLLALSVLYSSVFLGGFAVWTSTICRNTTLIESSVWVALAIPLIFTKVAWFRNASSGTVFGLSFFLTGLFVYCMKTQRRESGLVHRLGLLLLSFLAMYAFQGAVILLGMVVVVNILSHVRFTTADGRVALSIPTFRLNPAVGVMMSFAAYKALENLSPFKTVNYYVFQVANIPAGLAVLLTNWAKEDLPSLAPLLLLLPVWFLRNRAPHLRVPVFTALAWSVLIEIALFAGLEYVKVNDYHSYYLTYLSFLLVVFSAVAGVVLVNNVAQQLEQRLRLIGRVYSRALLVAGLGAAGLVLNATAWDASIPDNPLARMERTIGANTWAVVGADCDILIGDYWKVWPAVFAVNDYYYRERLTDSRTGTRRFVAGLSYRAWPTQFLWHPMLDWPNVRLCTFQGDERWAQWTKQNYIPYASLEKVSEHPPLEVFGLSLAGEYGNVQVREGRIQSMWFEFDRLIDGIGWGGPEVGLGGISFQWTSSTTTTFGVPLALDQDQEIEFRVVGSMAPDILDTLTLSVNNTYVPLERGADAGGGNTFIGKITRALLRQGSGRTQLTFATSRVISPASLGINNDPRQLGVALDWLRITPVK